MLIDQNIKDIAEIISRNVPAEKIYLFGSYAYGTPNQDSDYDFFVVIPDGIMRPLEVMKKVKTAIYDNMEYRIPVDILADYKSSFDDRSKLNTLEKKIVREGVLLYERN